MNDITFLHPCFAWALVACVIPIIIHLLQRHTKKRFRFSTMRFFPSGAMRSSKIRAIKKILLLLTRCAILAIIICLFLTPYNRKDLFSRIFDAPGEIFIYVDPTVSMEYNDDKATLRQKAFAIVDSLNRSLPQFAKKYIYDDARKEFVPIKLSMENSVGFSRHGQSNANEMIQAFSSNKMQGPNAIRYLIVLSDFQQKESLFFDTVCKVKQENPIALISVAPSNPWNYGLRQGAMVHGDNATVQTFVASFGKSLDNGSINAVVNGLRVGHLTVSVEKGKSDKAAISVKQDAANTAGFLQLENKDPFPLDNVAYFAQGTSRISRVLIVGDVRHEQNAFPLKAAFEAMGSTQWAVFNKKETEVTYGDIDSADVIVLADIHSVSQPLTMLFRGKIFGPKAILFSPLMDSSFAHVNSEIVRNLDKKTFEICADQRSHAITYPDTISSLFKGFRAIKDRDTEIKGYACFLPGEVLIKMDNGKALVTDMVDSGGNSWILFATSLCLQPQGATRVNNLPETGMYVVMLDRLARFALGAIRIGNKNPVAGMAFANPYFGAKGGAKVYDVKNNLIATWQRQKSVVIQDPGCYKIVPLQQPPYWVCAETDTAECDFTYRQPEIAYANKAMVRYFDAKKFIDFLQNKKKANGFVWLWFGLGFLFLAEVFLWEKRPFFMPNKK